MPRHSGSSIPQPRLSPSAVVSKGTFIMLKVNTGVWAALKLEWIMIVFSSSFFPGRLPARRRETGGRWRGRWPVWRPSVVSSSLGSRRTTAWPAAAGSSAGRQTEDEEEQRYAEMNLGRRTKSSAQLTVSWSVQPIPKLLSVFQLQSRPTTEQC